ncbi:MAG: tetratricopeptide repeat protein [Sedimentisphaerales bacterium]|nr:tetratricopeptide repeat protein [Sedimentisphaerales bacterium]
MTGKREKIYILAICVVLVLTSCVAYEQVRLNEFVDYDDNLYVTENPQVRSGFTRESVTWAFSNWRFTTWHPVTWLSHMLDYELFGLNPAGHHLMSLGFHIVNTLLLFYLLTTLTGSVWPSALVAALFALHPQHVESVAWASERKDVLSGFFWILTLIVYVGYVRRRGIVRYSGMVLLFILGLMAKPMLVTLPFVMLLLDYWPLGRLRRRRPEVPDTSESVTSEAGSGRVSMVSVIMEKVPLFILTAIFCVVTYLAQQKDEAMVDLGWLSGGYRIGNALVSYVSYLIKIVYPAGLAVLYPHPADSLPIWKPIVSLLVLLLISGVVLYGGRGRRCPALVTGWLWYLGTLVPVIGLVQVGVQAYADRYAYLPGIGVFIMIAWGGKALLGQWRYRQTVFAVFTAVIMILMLVGTRRQVGYWHDSDALFEHTLAVTKDNYVIHNNYGYYLSEQGRNDLAVYHFQEAVRIKPNYTNALNNLATVLKDQGNIEGAIETWYEVLKLAPDHASAHSNLGLTLAQKGRIDEAILHFKTALSIKPDWRSHLVLGLIYYQTGNYEAAIQQYNQSQQLKPDSPEVCFHLALAYTDQGNYERAVHYYQEAIRIQPDYFNAHNNLGNIYRGMGNHAEAVKHYYAALQIMPDYALVRLNLADTLYAMGNVKDAITQYYQVLESDPDQIEALTRLAWILATARDTSLRQPAESERLAQRLYQQTGDSAPETLNVLLTAYAEAGHMEQARETAEKAINLARSRGDVQFVQKIENMMKYYNARQATTPENSADDKNTTDVESPESEDK